MSEPLYIVWDDKYLSGVPIIDEHHRGLVALMNSFHYALREGRPLGELTVFKTLLDGYTEVHFRTEEALMRESEYPDLDAHIAVHQNLTKGIGKVEAEALSSGDPGVGLVFLKEWWVDHINGADKAFHIYLRGKM